MLSTKDFAEKQILFVFLESGEKIGFRNDNIVIKDHEDKIKHQSSCYLLFSLFICGHLCVTGGLIERAKRFGFSIVLMTPTMRVYGLFSVGAQGNVLLRKKQYSYDKLDLGAYLISNKIHNQKEALKRKRSTRSGKKESLLQVIFQLGEYEKKVLTPGFSLDEIMGIEGTAARQYFGQLFREHSWTARRPRVKQDIINCLLDIGYTLLFELVNALLEMYGFDPYVGVLHREFYHRKSLTCDMVEPFRPIVDMALFKALNLGQCKEKDFSLVGQQYFIGGGKVKPYLAFLMKAILEYKNEIFLYFQSYYRAFMRDKPIKEYPFFDLKG